MGRGGRPVAAALLVACESATTFGKGGPGRGDDLREGESGRGIGHYLREGGTNV